MKTFPSIKKIANKTLDLLFPDNIRCLICGSELDDEGMFCSHCSDINIYNEGKRCAFCDCMIKDENQVCNFCRDRKHLFKECVCPLNYNPIVRQTILKFKDDNAKYLAKPFAKLMYERLKQTDWKIDYLVSVPSHKNMIKKRGYNPAELLAEELSILTRLPVYNVLVKNAPSPNQKFMDYENRFKNIQYTMALTSKDFIKGKNILLVDDVITTCATIDACANLLVGAKNIYACGVARRNIVG